VSVLLADLQKALGLVKSSLAVEPERLSTADAVRVFELFVELERAVVAGKTLVAGRAAESGDWRQEGHRSPASWMARTAGTGLGEIQGLLQTSEALHSLPETTGALRRGELSAPQLKEIAATATADPGRESALLATAARTGLKGLKDECARVKARAVSETEARARYEQIRKSRSLTMWIDPFGVGRVDARLTPDDLGRFRAAITAGAEAVFKEARQAGRREPPVAYQADALVALVTGTASTGTAATGTAAAKSGPRHGSSRAGRSTTATAPPQTMMHLRVDVSALRRGKLEDGEVCEIPGVGPVPLATATHALGNALLNIVITDGVDVLSVTNRKRAIPAAMRTALENRDQSCVVPGCEVTRGLENDHFKIAFMDDGPTELWNLCRLCRWHHYLKTYVGYAITGGPGSWEWEAPVSETNPVLTA
jgi:hypothetical protein